MRCIRCPFLHHSERARPRLVTDVALALSEFSMRVCGAASGGWLGTVPVAAKYQQVDL